MNLRLGAVSGAWIALLAGFSLCSAAEKTHKGSPPAAEKHHKGSHPSAPKDSLAVAAPAHHIERPASIGGLVGVGQIFADADYSSRRASGGGFDGRDALARFAFAANFRYQLNSWLRWQVSPGFFWAAYDHASPLPFPDLNHPEDKTKAEVLTLVLPVSAQLQWTPSKGPWHYHVGAGPGVYRIWVENRRKVMKDPLTMVNHKGFYPGVSGQIGVERFLKIQPTTSIEVSMAAHWAFADRPEQFPNGFNSALLGVELKVGANYHFSTTRFEKKKSTTPATGH